MAAAPDTEGAPETATTPVRRRESELSRRFRHGRRRASRWLALTIAPPVLRAFARTWRPVLEGEENLYEARTEGRGHLVALWHGSMLLPVARHGHKGFSVLVSPSQDGDISNALLNRLGYGVVRGSSRKGAARALREMLERLNAGDCIVVTPDGPTGPPHTVAAGMAWLARATERPVVPCGFVAANAWRLKTWDRFTIPKPFSRVAFVYGAPVHVPRDGGEERLERASAEIRDAILAAERRGRELLGVEAEG